MKLTYKGDAPNCPTLYQQNKLPFFIKLFSWTPHIYIEEEKIQDVKKQKQKTFNPPQTKSCFFFLSSSIPLLFLLLFWLFLISLEQLQTGNKKEIEKQKTISYLKGGEGGDNASVRDTYSCSFFQKKEKKKRKYIDSIESLEQFS